VIVFKYYYGVISFVIAPDIGHVTEAVDSSPTAPDNGCHSEINTPNEYSGLNALIGALATGFILQVTVVPMKG
jgi:hypothetical protein